MSALTPRGPRANTPAKLPALQSIRVADPNVRQALQTLQEWVEVRLGSRGDRYERAVTFREFEPTVEELGVRIKALEVALAELDPGTDVADALSTAVDTLARSDIASLTIRVGLLELTVRTGGGSGGGSGTVTSVAMTVPAFLSVGGSPITGAGTLAVTLSGTALPVANGGTGATTIAAARAAFGETVSALTDGATISVDASLANNFRVTLGGNRTLANPTNLISGQVLNFRIKQDATGTRTLAYGSKYKFPGGTAPVLTTTASATDFMSCQYDSTDDTLICVLNKAFA